MSAAARGQFAEGAILDGRYAVDRKLGAGACAEVWLGHRIATNVSVPLLYPKLRLKFGDPFPSASEQRPGEDSQGGGITR